MIQLTKNNNEKSEEFEETCDCKSEMDTTPVVPYWISDEAPVIFREIHDMIHQGKGNLFIAFEMGSIRLDLENTSNYIEVNRTYIKIYNDETGETSVIRNDKITGFIYEPEPELNFEDLKEAINDRLEEMEE